MRAHWKIISKYDISLKRVQVFIDANGVDSILVYQKSTSIRSCNLFAMFVYDRSKVRFLVDGCFPLFSSSYVATQPHNRV